VIVSLLVSSQFWESVSSVTLFATDSVVEDDEEDEQSAHACAVVVKFVLHLRDC
jgi:hypothetical protein